MGGATKASKKRRYYRRYYRRYRNVSMNYFRVKAEFNDKLIFPNAEAGNLVFYTKRADNIEARRSYVTFTEMMNQYMYTNTLAGLFSYYKLTGIRIEVIPDARNNGLGADSEDPELYISYRHGSNNGFTLQECRSNNQSIMLDSTQRVFRYWKVYGADGTYSATSNYPAGSLQVQSNLNRLYAVSPSFKVKINLYLLYKQSKA